MLHKRHDRPLEIAAFLDQSGWGAARMEAFAADFSSRRYARLTRQDGATAILMDADANQNTPQFVAVARILREAGVAAPQIYAEQAEAGLLLLEDFGSRTIGALLDAGEDPKACLLRAAELLAHLHRNFKIPPNVPLPLFDSRLFTTQAELFLDGYFPFVKNRDATAEERGEFRASMLAVLRPLDKMPQSLLLRDFMPDNLMHISSSLPLAGRRGIAAPHIRQTSFRGEGDAQLESKLASIGVLDFQDAGIGPVAYDLASLCEEVRRDGAFAFLPDIVAHYRALSQSPLPQEDLLRACSILSAQRHIRILGIVTQLAVKSGRREKLSYLPRIEKHLAALLKEPYLKPLQNVMAGALNG